MLGGVRSADVADGICSFACLRAPFEMLDLQLQLLQAILLSILDEAWVSLHEPLREVGASAGGYGAAQNSGMGNSEVRGLAWRNLP